MAYSHIAINQATAYGSDLIRVIKLMQTARMEWKKLRDKMATMNDGADWSHGEAQCGIPTGKGGDVFYMLDVNYQNMMNDGSVTNGHTTMEQCLNQIG